MFSTFSYIVADSVLTMDVVDDSCSFFLGYWIFDLLKMFWKSNPEQHIFTSIETDHHINERVQNDIMPFVVRLEKDLKNKS